MNRPTRLVAAALSTLLVAAAYAGSGPASLYGRWTGTAELGPPAAAPVGAGSEAAPIADPSGAAEAAPEAAAAAAPEASEAWAETPLPFDTKPEVFGLRLVPADPKSGSPGGGLVDMPSRGLFGFPLDDLRLDSDGLSFSLRGTAPFDGRFELSFSPQSDEADGGAALSGRIRLLAPESGGRREVLAEGDFSLKRESSSSRALSYGFDYPVDTGRGFLPGSLLLPDSDSASALPVVLILSGAQADRDGNNYAVPGRSDSLLQLALSLRGRGVASFRFDQRGSGEAYALGADESNPTLDDHIDDAAAAIRALQADGRFSSVAVLGFGEGALVAACALEALPGSAFGGRSPVSGIAALCASGRNEAEIAQESLESAPEELKAEAAAIMGALKTGGRYPDPSPYFAGYFSPELQPYLASVFARDVRASFAAAAARCRALVAAGGSDLQVKLGETELLAASAPGCAYRVVPGMSHALKGVGGDEAANYASFTDPGLPLAEGLVDLVAAFARSDPLPPQMELPAASPAAPAAGSAPAPDGGEDPDDVLPR